MPAVRDAQRVLILALLFIVLTARASVAAPAKLARAEPRNVGLHPGRLGWIERGKPRLDDRIATHWPEFSAHVKRYAALWQDELSEFRNLRTRYLLYEGP